MDRSCHTISIIIPVFNDREGLLKCLSGVATQTYASSGIEVVVVDNASTPAIKIHERYAFDLNITYCSIPGSYAARNAGVMQAKGEILVFVDADCYPTKVWLEKGVESLARAESRCIIGGNVVMLPPEKRTGVGLYQYIVGFQQDVNIRKKKFSATANLFCFAEDFRKIGPFREELLSAGDREWAWRAVRRGFSVFYEEAAVVYTGPRETLSAGIRQARRVVAGRRQLKEMGLAHLGSEAVRAHRSGVSAMKWIVGNRDLTFWERSRVLFAASIIYCCKAFEMVRLGLGGRAERR